MKSSLTIRLVATNDRGIPVGQYHHNAILTDVEVEQVRDLHEFGGWEYADIAAAYGVSIWSIARICRYERRNQAYARWRKAKRVDARDEEMIGQD